MGMKKVLIGGLALLLLATAATAGAVRRIDEVDIRFGDIIIKGYGGFRPETLPRTQNAPITLYGGGKISTVSGELPPILDELILEFDRHGSVETKGLAVCRQAQIDPGTVTRARRVCGDAIVGKGYGKAVVKFPEQAPIPAGSPITLFNGPKKHGNPTVLAHAYLSEPVGPVTFVVPIEIETIHKGVYGYRTVAKIPRISGGYGHPVSGSLTIGRKWTFKGKRYSYVNARCQTGHLQARGEFTFKNGDALTGTFLRPCKVK